MITFSQLCQSVVFRAVILLVISWWIHWLWSRRRIYALALSLPGPLALPLLGNAIQLGLFGDHNGMVTRLKNMKRKYGEIFGVWMGPEFTLVISEAEDFEAILMNKSTYWKGKQIDVFKDVIQEGVFSSSGPFWKKRRHILNPSFSLKTIRSYQNGHNKYCKHVVEAMDLLCDKGLVDYTFLTRRYAADDIMDNLFETPMEFYTGKDDKLLGFIVKAGLIIYERICKIWLLPNIIFKNSNLGKNLKNILDIYHGTIHEKMRSKIEAMIEDRKQNMINQEDFSFGDLDNDLVNEERSNDVAKKSSLSVLVDAAVAGNLTVQEVLNEFDNILAPGLDTIYTQMSSFILMMAINKECQNKLWHEIKEVFKEDLDGDVETSHFAQLPYLDMVMKEVMRHFPTGPIQIRHLYEDFYFKHRDMVVPANTSLFLASFLLHKNPKYWNDPDSFMPERFSPEESAKRPYFAYVPYSAGLRNCIAQIFGNDSLKTAAVHLIRNYEFHSDLKMKDIIFKSDISMRSGTGYYAIISRRDRNS